MKEAFYFYFWFLCFATGFIEIIFVCVFIFNFSFLFLRGFTMSILKRVLLPFWLKQPMISCWVSTMTFYQWRRRSQRREWKCGMSSEISKGRRKLVICV